MKSLPTYQDNRKLLQTQRKIDIVLILLHWPWICQCWGSLLCILDKFQFTLWDCHIYLLCCNLSSQWKKKKWWLASWVCEVFCFVLFFNSQSLGLWSSKKRHIPIMTGHLNFLDITCLYCGVLSLKNLNHLLSKCVRSIPGCWPANCWWINICISNYLYRASFSTGKMRVSLTLDSKNHESSYSQGMDARCIYCNNSLVQEHG